MSLEYGINFNTEKGLKEAQTEIEKWRKEFQGQLNKNPLDFSFGGKDFGKDIDKSASGAKKSIKSINDEIKALREAFRDLELGDSMKEDGDTLIEMFLELKDKAGKYAGTIDAAAKSHRDLEPESLSDKIKELSNSWNKLTLAQREGNVGQTIIAEFIELQGTAGLYAQSLSKVANAQNAVVASVSLKDQLNNLSQAWDRLTESQRKGAEGQGLIQEFSQLRNSAGEFVGSLQEMADAYDRLNDTSAKGQLQNLEKQWESLSIEQRKGAEGRVILDNYKKITNEAGVHLGSIKDVLRTEEQRAEATKVQTKEIKKQSDAFNQLKSYAMNFLSVYAGIRMAKNLYAISGELEMQLVSMKAILQNAEQGEAIFNRIKTLAVQSPFEFKDIIAYTKQLSAFSVPYEELYDTTKMLADVSSGLGVDMARIILAYGQVRSASVLRGQELRQFTEAGIPLVDNLAQKFTELNGEIVTTGEVFELISERKVPFEMIAEIFKDMTSEGGKFYMMQEKQADTLQGRVNNLKDALTVMMYDLGTSMDGILKGSIDLLKFLMAHWETLGRAIMSVVAVKGIYTAAVKLNTIATTANVAVQRYSIASKNLNTAATIRNIIATKAATVAQGALNTAMALNPYVAVGMALTAIVGTAWALSDGLTEAERAQKKFNDAQEKHIALLEEQKNKIRGLVNAIKDDVSTTREKYKALRELQDLYPSIFADLDMEAVKHMDIAKAIRMANEETQKKRDYSSTDRLTYLNSEIERLDSLLNSGAPLYGSAGALREQMEGLIRERELINKEQEEANEADRQARLDTLDIEGKINFLKKENANLMGSLDDESVERKYLQNQKLIKELEAELNKPKVTFDDIMLKYQTALTKLAERQKELRADDNIEAREAVTLAEEEVELYKSRLQLMGWKEPTKGKTTTEKDDTQQRLDALYAQDRMEKKLAFERQKFNLELKEANDKRTLEGYDLELALIQNKYEREQIAIKEREDALIESNIAIARKQWESEGKKGAFKSEGSLSTIDDIEIRKREEEANSEQLYAKQELYKKLTEQFQDYAEQIKQIQDQLQKDLKNLEAGRTSENSEDLDRRIAQAQKEANDKIGSLRFDELKNSQTWKVLFSDLEDYTLKTLKKSLEEVASVDTSNLNPADAKAVQNAIDKLKKHIGDGDPFFAIRTGWEEMIDAFKEGNMDGVVSSMNLMQLGVDKFKSSLTEIQEPMGQIFGEDSDMAYGVGVAIDALGAVEELGGALASFASGDIIGGITGVVKGIGSIVQISRNAKKRKADREIKRQEGIVRDLSNAYDELARSMKKALGTDYYNNAKKQSENLLKQAEAIQRQIDAENKKSKKDRDTDKIADWEKQKQDLKNQAEDVVNEAIDKLTGTNLTSAAEEFASAWLDAYASFGDTTDAINLKFKQMMKDMILNAVLSKIMQKELEPLFKFIDKSWEKDGELTVGSIVEALTMSGDIADSANNKLLEAMKILEAAGIDIKDAGETNLTGISKGIAGLSEDTALILGGLLDSIRFRMFSYFDLMSSPENMGAVANMLLAQNQMIFHLAAIEANTKATADNTLRLADSFDKVVSTSDNRGAYSLNVNT